jgi:hypothetical protein
MSSLTLTIKKDNGRKQRILVEIDAGQFERLAAQFGFFGDDFLKSIDRAEKDIKAGRIRKVKSLRELRSKNK